jgi:UDP-galactopyranose mutase
MTRLSAEFSIFFVEEPEFVDGGRAELRVTHDSRVTILTPLLPAASGFDWGFNDATNAEIKRLLTCPSFGDASPHDVVWHYTPMSLGAAPDAFDSALIVYDAMDELVNFRGAPVDLAARERNLLDRADLVFTGGPSLYEQRKDSHLHVHCFPSGVDAAHFAPNPGRVSPVDSASWSSPVLGFYGVLDERIDFELIAGIADLRRGWTIVMIGPLAKITEDELPRRSNIHYPGKRSYQDLPAYLDRFDVALLPFALNDATKFISPTKTLEYLAAEKPVISTPIRDVVDLYGDAVEIAANPQEFVDTIDALLADPGSTRRRIANRLVAEHDWDRIAAEMIVLVNERLAARHEIEPALFLAR